MNILAFLGIIPTLYVNIRGILIGKFIFGLASGTIIVASSIYLNETVPVEKSSSFDFTTNFGVILGVTICLGLGLGLPDPSVDLEEAKATEFWKYINGMPLLFTSVSVINWVCFFKHESLRFCYTIKDHDMAKQQIARIYDTTKSEEIEKIFDKQLEV